MYHLYVPIVKRDDIAQYKCFAILGVFCCKIITWRILTYIMESMTMTTKESIHAS
jgi:hypothetical protein